MERSAVPSRYWKWFLPGRDFFKDGEGDEFDGYNFLGWERRYPPKGRYFVIVELWFVVSSRENEETYLYVIKKRASDVVAQYGTLKQTGAERLIESHGQELLKMSKAERSRLFRKEEQRAQAEAMRGRLESAERGEPFSVIKNAMPLFIEDMAERLSHKTTDGSRGVDVQGFVGWAAYLPPDWADFVRKTYPRRGRRKRK